MKIRKSLGIAWSAVALLLSFSKRILDALGLVDTAKELPSWVETARKLGVGVGDLILIAIFVIVVVALAKTQIGSGDKASAILDHKSQPIVSRKRRWPWVASIGAMLVLLVGISLAWIAPGAVRKRPPQAGNRSLADTTIQHRAPQEDPERNGPGTTHWEEMLDGIKDRWTDVKGALKLCKDKVICTVERDVPSQCHVDSKPKTAYVVLSAEPKAAIVKTTRIFLEYGVALGDGAGLNQKYSAQFVLCKREPDEAPEIIPLKKSARVGENGILAQAWEEGPRWAWAVQHLYGANQELRSGKKRRWPPSSIAASPIGAQVEDLRTPEETRRDPNAFYQYGVLVAKVNGANADLPNGKIVFVQIAPILNSILNPDRSVEYQDLLLNCHGDNGQKLPAARLPPGTVAGTVIVPPAFGFTCDIRGKR